MVEDLFRKCVFGAIAFLVIANLFFIGNVSAKIELDDKDVERIKTGLSLMKTAGNIVVSDDKIKTIMNTILGGAETGTDITYGLVALSALNEMDMVDMVVSQRFKTDAQAYFNSILDEKLNLVSYWKGIGYDFVKVLMGKNILGPMSALTLNAFSISNEAVNIFIGIKNLQMVKLYEGMWFYFDQRRYNTSHQEAWSDALDAMGWAANLSSPYSLVKIDSKNMSKLEAQFSALWDKWGEHIDSNGIKKEFRSQVEKEFQEKFLKIKQEQELAKINKGPSFWDNLSDVAYAIFQGIVNVFVRNNPAGGASISQSFQPDSNSSVQGIQGVEDVQNAETLPSGEEESADLWDMPVLTGDAFEINNSKSLDDLKRELDEITKKSSLITQELKKLMEENEPKEALEEEQELLEKEKKKDEVKEMEPAFCERISVGRPLRDRVVINEVAWMGTENLANDEWIELKNISNGQIDLTGWQILDKDKQIKAVFPKKIILSGGYFLLERTDDFSAPTVTADLIYTGTLSNSDEALYLFDAGCQIQDEVLAEPNWPSGDSAGRRTMEKRNDSTWQSSLNPGGTPKANNSNGYFVLPNNGGKASNSTSSSTATSTSTSASASISVPVLTPAIGILISEVQITGGAGKTDNDFIELHNPNNSTVNLKGHRLVKRTKVGVSDSSIKSWTADTFIPAKGYYLWANSDYADVSAIADVTTSSTLADDNGVALRFGSEDTGAIIDSVGWGLAQNAFVEGAVFSENPSVGKSIVRKWDEAVQNYKDTNDNSQDFELGIPTPKTKNIKYEARSRPEDDQPLAEVCGSGHFDLCLIDTDCQGANGFWYNGICNTEQAPEPTTSKEVVINEVAWMGTKASFSDEWLELYNNTDREINLEGWTLKAEDESPKIILKGVVLAKGHFLLERTNDTTISDIKADQIYTGALEDGGEKLQLFDGQNNLIDLVDCSSAWFKDDKDNKITMERISAGVAGSDPNNWANNNIITRNGQDAGKSLITGTPKAENSVSKSSTEVVSIGNQPFDEFSEVTLTYLGQPYIIGSGGITIPQGKTLKIEPGVALKFRGQMPYGPYFRVEGTLKALGANDKKINFTNISEGGYWGGIYFSSTSKDSVLDNVFIKDAMGPVQDRQYVMRADNSSIVFRNSEIRGYNNSCQFLLKNSESEIDDVSFSDPFPNTSYVAICIEGGAPIIKNSFFKNNTTGINISGETKESPNFRVENNVFEENGTPIILWGNASWPVFSGNQAQNNKLNGILVSHGRSITADTVWNADLTYVVAGIINVSPEATLTIGPGTVIKFNYESWITNHGVFIYGGLKVLGTAEKPVIFTSVGDDGQYNFWKAINLMPGSKGDFENVVIRYGGTNFASGGCDDWWGDPVMKITQAQAILNNITMDSPSCIALGVSDSDISIENSKFIGRTKDGSFKTTAVFIQNANKKATIKNSVFENNYYGFVSYSDKEVILENNLFKGNDIPVIIGGGDFYPVGNILEGNWINGFEIKNDRNLGNITLRNDNDIPYVADRDNRYSSDVTISVSDGRVLTIEPGVILKIFPYGGIEVYGKLKAEGTAEKPIIFTSIFDDSYGGNTNNGENNLASLRPKSWRYLGFYSPGSSLNWAVVKYGGGWCQYGSCRDVIFKYEGGDVDIQNTIFENNE